MGARKNSGRCHPTCAMWVDCCFTGQFQTLKVNRFSDSAISEENVCKHNYSI